MLMAVTQTNRSQSVEPVWQGAADLNWGPYFGITTSERFLPLFLHLCLVRFLPIAGSFFVCEIVIGSNASAQDTGTGHGTICV